MIAEVKMLILTASFCFRPLFRIPSLHTLYQTAKKYQESVLAFPYQSYYNNEKYKSKKVDKK